MVRSSWDGYNEKEIKKNPRCGELVDPTISLRDGAKGHHMDATWYMADPTLDFRQVHMDRDIHPSMGVE